MFVYLYEYDVTESGINRGKNRKTENREPSIFIVRQTQFPLELKLRLADNKKESLIVIISYNSYNKFWQKPWSHYTGISINIVYNNKLSHSAESWNPQIS